MRGKKRIETCAGCERKWNVSVKAPKGWYICPHCEYAAKKIRSKQANPVPKNGSKGA